MSTNQEVRLQRLKRGTMICFKCCHPIREKKMSLHKPKCAERLPARKRFVASLDRMVGKEYYQWCLDQELPCVGEALRDNTSMSNIEERLNDDDNDEKVFRFNALKMQKQTILKELTARWELDFEPTEEFDEETLEEMEFQEMQMKTEQEPEPSSEATVTKKSSDDDEEESEDDANSNVGSRKCSK